MHIPTIELKQIALSYNQAPLLAEVQLTLPAKHCTCLLGPSGVGKTSLLRLLAGLKAHETGEIICDDGLELQNRIAYMAQSDGLLPWLTVFDNTVLGQRLRKERINREKATHLLTAAGLQHKQDSYPNQLSGGMRQRVALARTLMEDKPVVLMDEPFASLDAITKWQLQDLSSSLLQDKTVLLVTHDPLEALRLADTIHILAGKPANIQYSMTVDISKPRRADDPALTQRQAQLMHELTKAKEQSE